MIPALANCLWEILESEAWGRFFIDDAEKPAFLILHRHNPFSSGKFELLMNHVGRLGEFNSLKKTLEALDKVLSTATKPKRIYHQKKKGYGYGEKKRYATIRPDLPKQEVKA